MIRLIWILLGVSSLALGAIGVFMPVLPTVPFILLAAFAFERSSPRLQKWLLANKTFGPMIRDWRERGAISRNTKIFTTLSLVAAVGIQLLIQVPLWLLAVEMVIFAGVLTFIWTRPEH